MRFFEWSSLDTGGLGAIGLHVAQWLAARGAKRLLLTNRKGRVTEEAASILSILREGGVDIDVITVDVSDRDALFRCIGALNPDSLKGIFHAAGVDLQLPIKSFTVEAVQMMLAAKVAGTMNLDELAREHAVEHFVCFSSIASVWGSTGRSLYAAANGFMDTLVARRREAGLPGISINWGPWAEGGMADTVSLEQMARIGIHGLNPAKAVEALEHLLRCDTPQAIAADVDWNVFLPIFELRRSKSLFDSVRQQTPNNAKHKFQDSTAKHGGVSDNGSTGMPWLEALADIDTPERTPTLVRLVRAEFGRLTRSPDPSRIPTDRNLFDIGMDSLLAAELTNAISKKTGLREHGLVFGTPSIESIADGLNQQLGAVNPLPLIASTPTGPSVVGYTRCIEQSVFDFYRRAWPRRRNDWIEPRWRWMFLDSAKRVSADPKVWLLKDHQEVVGHHGAQFVRLKAGNHELSTAWFVDTMVLPEYQRQGGGVQLVIQSREEMPLSLSLGQTEQMKKILLQLGWKYVADLQTYLLPLHPTRVLHGKVPPSLLPLVAAGLRSKTAIYRMRQSIGSVKTELRKIDYFSEIHDDIWRKVSVGLGCCVVRDASYLNWKYIDQPGQEFICLEAYRNNRVVGCVVLKLSDADDMYHYARAHIVDIVCRHDLSELHSLLESIQRYCRHLGVDAIIMHVISRLVEQALADFGFVQRTPTRQLLVSPDQSNEAKQLIDPTEWFVTHGDSDIDRPW